MIAPNTSTETFRVRIKRQDDADSPAYWEEYEVENRPQMNVISALQAIAADPVTVDGKQSTPIVYDCACLEEVCGSCTMLVNGQVRQSCSAVIADLLKDGNTITLEPMTKFPVVRDLFVDRTRMFEDLEKIEGWVPIDGTYDLGPGPEETQKNQQMRYALSRCMTCGCCLEVCPQYTRDNDFVGASTISQVRYFNAHETGAQLKDDRLSVMSDPGGITDCGNAQNCVKVCPKEIPLTESIADIGRQTTWYKIRKFFSG